MKTALVWSIGVVAGGIIAGTFAFYGYAAYRRGDWFLLIPASMVSGVVAGVAAMAIRDLRAESPKETESVERNGHEEEAEAADPFHDGERY